MNVADYADLYAERAHRGQERKYNGQPYIVHPRRVAAKLMELNKMYTGNISGCYFLASAIAAAYLHDVIEDCKITKEQLAKDFDANIADLVYNLTNTSKITHPNANRAMRKQIDRSKLGALSAADRSVARVVHSIKAADRIDNLNDLGASDPDFLAVYLEESKLLLEVLDRADIRLRDELRSTIERLQINGQDAPVLCEVQEQAGQVEAG